MKNHLLTGALFALLPVLAACGGGEQRQEPTMDNRQEMAQDEDLNQLRSRLVNAFSAGDARGLSQLFAEDAVMIPSAGTEIKGRQAIQDTYSKLWQSWQVAQFNLTPQEGKIADDWAFERGTVTVQVVPRGGAAPGGTTSGGTGTTGGQGTGGTAGQNQQGATGAGQQPGQAGQTGAAGNQGQGAAAGQGGDQTQMTMDTSYYVFVMNKKSGDWKISWFVSTNPPEYSAQVTADAGRGGAGGGTGTQQTRPQGGAGRQQPGQ